MRFNRLNDVRAKTSYQHLRELVRKYVVPKLGPKLGYRHLLDFERADGLTTIRLLPTTRGEAYRSLTLHPDGTITTPPGQENHGMLAPNPEPLNHLLDKLRSTIAQSCMEDSRVRPAFLRLVAQGHNDLVYDCINNQARAYVADELSTAITPGGPRTTDPKRVAALWNRLVRTHLLDPKVTTLVGRYAQQSPAPSCYNAIVRNLAFIEREKGSLQFPHIFSYMLTMPEERDSTKPFATTDELMRRVAMARGIPTEHLPYLACAVSTHRYDPTGAELRAACKALADCGTPPDHPMARRIAVLEEHRSMLEAGQEAWSEWTEAIRQSIHTGEIGHISAVRERLRAGLKTEKRNQAANGGPGHYKTATSEVLEYISTTARKAVTEQTPRWEPVVVKTHQGTTTLKGMSGPQGDAAVTVRRNRDGTIRFTSAYTKTWQAPFATDYHLTAPLIHDLAYRLLAETAHQLPEKVREIVGEHITLQGLGVRARAVAKQIARDTVATRPEEADRLISVVNKAIRKHIIDPKSYQLTKEIFREPYSRTGKSENPSIRVYNFTKKNFQTFQQLWVTGQRNPLRYYALNLFGLNAEIPTFKHPGEVIASVKSSLDMTPTQWRAFCRHGSVSGSQRPGTESLRGLRLACQVLADANRNDADATRAQQVITHFNRHHGFNGQVWSHGDPWKAWTNVIGRFIEPGDELKDTDDLNRVADALRYHIVHDLPWGSGDWATVVARADRWHQETFGPRAAYRYNVPQEARESKWESALPQTTIDGIVFTPLRTAMELQKAGGRMDNCLATFYHRCEQGESIIFTARLGPSKEAAVELVRIDSDWRVGQVELVKRATPAPTLRAAAAKLARKYQEACAQDAAKIPAATGQH